MHFGPSLQILHLIGRLFLVSFLHIHVCFVMVVGGNKVVASVLAFSGLELAECCQSEVLRVLAAFGILVYQQLLISFSSFHLVTPHVHFDLQIQVIQ